MQNFFASQEEMRAKGQSIVINSLLEALTPDLPASFGSNETPWSSRFKKLKSFRRKKLVAMSP